MYGSDYIPDIELDDGFFYESSEAMDFARSQTEDNQHAWIEFALKTESELLKNMVMNQTCIPFSQTNPEEKPAPDNTEQPADDWQWVPVGEPNHVPGFSETRESDPSWNRLVDDV